MTGSGEVEKIRHGATRKPAERGAGHDRGCKRYGHQARKGKAIVLWAGQGMVGHRSCSFGRVGGRHVLISLTAFRIANGWCERGNLGPHPRGGPPWAALLTRK